MSVRLPRLLAPDLSEARRLSPTAMSLQLALKDVSTASITLPRDQAGLAMHDFVELYTATGSAGLFRVTTFDDTVRSDQALNLRHAIDTLSDSVWNAQEDYSGTVPDFLSKLLAKQKTAWWQLGTVQDTAAYKRSGINYDRLSDLFAQLLEDRHDFYPVYDFSTTPWTLSLMALPEGAACEFRLSRNVEACRVNRNDADLCTRLYLSVCNKKAVTLKQYNNAAAQAVYGIVEKTADVDVADVPDADAWAADFLSRRAAPAVTISIDGYQLAALTGDSFDAFSLGRVCRVALPEEGVTYLERVVAVSYPDPLGQPERVTVELANRLAKFSESIASLKKAAGAAGGAARGAGRAAAGNAEEITYWSQIVQHHDSALDATGIETLYETGIELDAETGATIYSLVQGFQSQYAQLKVQNGAITSEVSRATEAEGNLSSSITQQANRIDLVVSGTGSSAAIRIGKIVEGINASQVVIQADRINLDGYVTVSNLAGTGASTLNRVYATTVSGGSVAATGSLSAGGQLSLTSGADFIYHGTTLDEFDVYLTGVATGKFFGRAALNLNHSHAVTVGSDGTVTLGAASTTGGSFRIADTKTYLDGVSAAYQSGKDAMGVEIDGRDIKVAQTNVSSYTVGAAASITYNATSHRYTAHAYAGVGTVSSSSYMHSASSLGGTQAYADGVDDGKPKSVTHVSHTYNSAGRTYSITVKITSKNGDSSNMSFTMAI